MIGSRHTLVVFLVLSPPQLRLQAAGHEANNVAWLVCDHAPGDLVQNFEESVGNIARRADGGATCGHDGDLPSDSRATVT